MVEINTENVYTKKYPILMVGAFKNGQALKTGEIHPISVGRYTLEFYTSLLGKWV